MLSRVLFFVVFIYSTSAASAPFITKCKIDDSKCIKQTTQNAIPIITAGIPELGIETLDPFTMKSMDASSKGLKLLIEDITGTGLKDCHAKKIQSDGTKSKLFVKLQCSVDFKGKYEMNGRLLILPIEGKGDAHVILRKMVINVEADMGEVDNNGQKFWHIKNWKHSYDLKDQATIELENLFNGNELLGRAARELIASSSNEIVKEVGPPIVKSIVAKIIDNVENMLSHIPTSELFVE